MSDEEVYRLARAGDVRSIKPLLDLLTVAALEILRLETAAKLAEVEAEAGRYTRKGLLRMLFPCGDQ